MNRHMKWLASTAVAAFAGAVLAQSASATTIAYEGFDYSAGTFLPGQSGGSGWSGAWAGTQGSVGTPTEYQNTAAITPNFTYTGLSTTGNRAQVQNGTITRQLAGGALGAVGSTVWFSFGGMLNSWLGNNNMHIGLAFTNNGTQVLSIGQGNGDGVTAHGLDNSWTLATALGDATDQTRIIDAKDGGLSGGTSLDQFFVGKIQFNAGGTTVEIWANPDLNGAAPINADAHFTDSDFHAFTFDGILLSDNQHDGKPQFDEIRIGTDFASVISTPEPASLALLGLGGLMMVKRRRRTVEG